MVINIKIDNLKFGNGSSADYDKVRKSGLSSNTEYIILDADYIKLGKRVMGLFDNGVSSIEIRKIMDIIE